MNVFECLTADQVNSVHKLYYLLRKLKVIGIVYTTTKNMRNTGVGHPTRYKLVYGGYDSSMKNKLTAEEHLEQFFIASSELAFYTEDSE